MSAGPDSVTGFDVDGTNYDLAGMTFYQQEADGRDTFHTDGYPANNRVLDSLGFTSEDSQALDKSIEGNNVTLKSGRGVSLDGVNDYLIIPALSSGQVKTVVVLAKAQLTRPCRLLIMIPIQIFLVHLLWLMTRGKK